MALLEYVEEKKLSLHFQIFGTDLNEPLIKKARAGLYPTKIATEISPNRLRRFFIKTETGYKISKRIREMCIFAKHDVTSSPPLSNIDIGTCRNLLIYFDTFLQNKVLSMLHYALNPKGFLVLGKSESISAAPQLFTLYDKNNKIFLKRAATKQLTSDNRTSIALAGHGGGEKPIETPRGAKISVKKDFAKTVETARAITEEKETLNEELKAANEEIQSSNEELQSVNEELETSKEELQSTNEELISLNDELQNGNAELTRLNNDLINVFASTNIPMIIIGNDMCIKRYTPTARKMMNLIPSDINRPVGDIKLNINIDNLEEIIFDVMEDMVPRDIEVTDKEGKWYSMRVRPYRTIEKKIEGAIIAMIDINDIKHSRIETQVALDYSQAIIETMSEPMIVLDRSAHVISANNSFYETFKVSVSDMKKTFYELNGRRWNDPKLRKLLEEILPKKSHFSGFEITLDFPEIGRRTVVLNGRQIKMHGKEKQMILLVFQDITDSKKANDLLMRDSENLEKLVQKRSKELLEMRVHLERSKHLSDIGTLAATVAHELRNTLAAISVATYNIRKKANIPQIKGSLSSIEKKVNESDQIINNVLSYSKIKVSHFEPVKINDIMQACVLETKRQVGTENILFKCETGSTMKLSIEADANQIKEVFSNILNNARDAVSEKTGVIRIKTSMNKTSVMILVKDNGVGIEKKNLAKVITPFFTTKAKGTGLGLAICHQIMMLHDGSMQIESVTGKGTEVTVTLPKIRTK